jgi:hypothetical protein
MRGQLTTSEVLLSATSPAACACLICANDFSSRGVAPAFQVTFLIAHSGGYAVCPGAIVSPAMFFCAATPFVTV